MKFWIMLAFGIAMLAFLVGGGFYSYFKEKKKVKQGHCGMPWGFVDQDSQGGIWIQCQKCGADGDWVSWYQKGITDHSETPWAEPGPYKHKLRGSTP